MEKSELQAKMLELMDARKQRELTVDEKREAVRLFKKAVLEPDTQPLKTHTRENEILLEQKKELRRQFEQQVHESPSKAHTLRMWELGETNTYERKLTAEERAELLRLMMQQHPELAALADESGEDPIAGQ
jgi:hypothetical protein